MRHYEYPLDEGGPARLRVEIGKQITVRLDGQMAAQLSLKEARVGRDIALPDSSTLHVTFKGMFPTLLRNGLPVPGWDLPARKLLKQAWQTLLFVGGLSVILAMLIWATAAGLLPAHRETPLSSLPATPAMVGGGILVLAGLFAICRWWPGLVGVNVLVLVDTVYLITKAPGRPMMAWNLIPHILIMFVILGATSAIRFLRWKPEHGQTRDAP